MSESILLVILGILVLIYSFIKSLDYFKDVPDLYLLEQSNHDAVRLQNESPIYRSNKLETGHIRSGLDIRYNSYKLRSGNLCDIWTILINHLQYNKDYQLTIEDQSIPFSKINYIVHELIERIKNKYTCIRIPINHDIDYKWIIVVIAGLISQTTIEFYEFDESKENAIDIDALTLAEHGKELYSYENIYDPIKDKGIAIRIIRKLNSGIMSTIEFTQLNIVSSLASTIKHLPSQSKITTDDSMLIITNHQSNEQLMNIINKFLMGLITHPKLTLSKDISKINSIKPTILSIPENLLPMPLAASNIFLQFKQWLLSRGIFIKGSNNLRLIYLNNSINQHNPKYNCIEISQLRTLYQAHIIQEWGYYNVLGPIILSDYYEYRTFAPGPFGCICQSLEVKLTHVDEKRIGIVNIRGYIIGKTANRVIGRNNMIEDNKDVMGRNDGFMPLRNVRGKWGNDGCLYIM
ncbi:uncharacterized protein J8A68_005605 [[Candida] subhashii]|uniref:Uncharacterized protein n=1 Tax=[Candida] subhashii TaxID=561895 RepID=A0A8J5QG44_9ASCO|nr:uncharacterized protein J8A68_005605 [[Candida] subhashii]KAG7660930.1 hypothetical protein J8A68_005605 [[Candida] subhashii]